MKRITMKRLVEKASELNQARGVENNSIGAIKIYSAYGLYAVDMIINAGHGVRRLYGLATPKECMQFLYTI